MKTCTTARTSFTSASTLVDRTSANVIRIFTLLTENAEVTAKVILKLLFNVIAITIETQKLKES